MKKIVIIRSSGNELANQLWNYISVYAYALENSCSIVNPAFFEYGEYFNMKSSPSRLFNLIFFKPFKKYTERKTALRRRLWRKMYSWYSIIILFFYRDRVITSHNKVYYLPPARELLTDHDSIYFDGWLFRNPKGIDKYREEIHEYFRPQKYIDELVKSTIDEIRGRYTKIVGIHIRQSDYMTWRNGEYFIPQKRVREIIDEYIMNFSIDTNRTCFVFTSDGLINTDTFSGLNIFISKNNAVTDLFLLSSTDTILGSNSTFGAFASYYGNIPHIIMQREDIDWEYYRDKTSYFENKYSTFVNY